MSQEEETRPVSRVEETRSSRTDTTSATAARPAARSAASERASGGSQARTATAGEGTPASDSVDIGEKKDGDRAWYDPRRLLDAARDAAKPKPAHEVLEDGTVIDRKDGRTTTTRPGGSVQVEYRQGDNDITETTYTRGGARVREREVQYPNGDTETVSDVRRGNQTVRTVSRTSESDRAIEGLAPGAQYADPDGEPLSGERNPTQVTSVTQTVIDHSTHPPRSTDVMSRTTYSQHIPLGDRDPNEAGLLGHDDRIGPFPVVGQFPPGSLDRHDSGQTLAYSVTTVLGPDGKRHSTTESGSTVTLQGPTVDGRDGSYTETHSRTEADGKTKEVRMVEAKGLLHTDRDKGLPLNAAGQIDRKEDYRKRLGEGSIDFRSTDVYETDADGKVAESHVEEYGDYDDPEGPGRSVTITNDGERTSWTYRRADENEAGLRVRTQTGVEGSTGYVLTDGQFNEDGTFLNETWYMGADGAQEGYDQRERVLVDPATAFTEEQGYYGDPAYAEEFAAGGGPIYRDTAMTSHGDEQHKVMRYSAGDRALTTTLDLSGEEKQATTLLEDASSDRPARLQVEGGPEYSVTRDGRAWATVDGEQVEIPHADVLDAEGDEGGNPLAVLDSASGSGRYLYASLRKFRSLGDSEDFGEKHPKLNGALGGLSVATGAMSLVTGVKEGEPGQVLSGMSAITSGLADVSGMAARSMDDSRMLRVLKVGGPTLGAAGAVFSGAYGIYQISEGDTVGGAISLAGAAGSGVAVAATVAGATGWVPVAGWVVAGTAIVAGVGYDLWKANQAEHATADLEF